MHFGIKLPAGLQQLKRITAPWHLLPGDALFAHSQLEVVSAAGLELSDTWRGRAAEGSKIWRLKITGSMDDEEWCKVPTLPELAELNARYKASANERHRGLAGMLSRHASTLHCITLYTADVHVFEETLPEERVSTCRCLASARAR